MGRIVVLIVAIVKQLIVLICLVSAMTFISNSKLLHIRIAACGLYFSYAIGSMSGSTTTRSEGKQRRKAQHIYLIQPR